MWSDLGTENRSVLRLSTGDFHSQLKKEDDRGVAHGSETVQGGLESGGKDNAKQTNKCLLRAL